MILTHYKGNQKIKKNLNYQKKYLYNMYKIMQGIFVKEINLIIIKI